MKGMLFLDDNCKEVKLPKDTCTREEFKDFIHKVYYIYFDIPERMKWFQNTYRQFDDMNSIFDKKFCGIYSYDEETDYWSSDYSEVTCSKVLQAYNEKVNKDNTDI